MANVTEHVANSIMGKIYDVLTNGDATVPKSADNFFSWCTLRIPVDPLDFRFLTGFTGVVKKATVDQMIAATRARSSGSSSGAVRHTIIAA